MIGVGNMGGMMSLLFAEHGIEVFFYDPAEQMSTFCSSMPSKPATTPKLSTKRITRHCVKHLTSQRFLF
jgi:hypothetical protein